MRGRQEIADGEAEIKENQQKLIDAEKELDNARRSRAGRWMERIPGTGKRKRSRKISDGEQKLADARKEIQDIEEPEWIVTDRNALPEYSDYGDVHRIEILERSVSGNLFSGGSFDESTTMTRMVEEQRTDRNPEGAGLR